MNVMLKFNRNETVTRPEAFGTPAAFGTLEWFDVVDRETGELLLWQVNRLSGGVCSVYHPDWMTATVHTLNAAAELINGRRIPEVRARDAR